MLSKRKTLGVDPGINGAVAMIGQGFLSVKSIPTAGESKHRMIAAPLLSSIIRLWAPDEAVIEKVSAMPGQGVSSMFRFGQALGTIEGILGGLEIPIVYVSPNVWKRHYGLHRQQKDDARMRAIQYWPRLADELNRKKDVDKADALLIANWKRETVGNERKKSTDHS